MQDSGISYAPRHRGERLIAAARVLLAATALLAIWIDPTEPRQYVRETAWLLLAYLGYALLLLGLMWNTAVPRQRAVLATHLIDLAAFSWILTLTQGPESPFFAFLVFSLFSAATRWQQRGTLVTALGILVLFLGLGLSAYVGQDPAFELNGFIVRGAYLGVVTLFLWSSVTYEQHVREDLQKLGGWVPPEPPPGDPGPLFERLLRHGAEMLGAPRVVMIWDDPEEPYRNLAVLDRGGFQWAREAPDLFEPPVAAALGDADFFCRGACRGSTEVFHWGESPLQEWNGQPLHPDLCSRFAVESVVAVRLGEGTFEGVLLFLDRPSVNADDLLLARMVARQVTAALKQQLLQERLRDSALVEQRVRLGRDLHDGLLQSLTVIGLRLEAIKRQLPEGDHETRQKVKDLQALMVDEQRGLRRVIRALQPLPGETDAVPEFGEKLEELARKIREQWGLEVVLAVSFPAAEVPGSLRREVELLLQEALTNSARHARAASVRATLGREGDALVLTVADDGRGFPFHGRFDLGTLRAQNLGPWSLKERLTALGGSLRLDSSESGSRLEMRLPLVTAPSTALRGAVADRVPG